MAMAHVFWNRVLNNPPGRWFGTNRKRVWDFLLVLNNNLGPICPVSEVLQLVYAKSKFYPYPTPITAKILGRSLWSRSMMFHGDTRHSTSGQLTVQLFSKY